MCIRRPGKLHERGALFFLLVWMFMLFTSTFAHMVIAFNDTAENGGASSLRSSSCSTAADGDSCTGNLANVAFSLCLIFCGVLATPDQFPGFWFVPGRSLPLFHSR